MENVFMIKDHRKYDLTRQTTKHVVLVVLDRQTTINVEPCLYF